ncbi:hypothetical protein B0H14DRAFT_2716974 [Mycena olivaceomarginata]|nr:hypothetical protein B0H14DRAFT_2716974 [Mycena olivaceomarginata]
MPARIPDTTRTTACVLCCCFPSPTPPPSPSPLCGPGPTSVKFCPHRSPSRLPPSSVPQPAPSTCAAPFPISYDSFVPSPPTASITSVRIGRSSRSPRTRDIPSLPARLPTPARQTLTLRRLGRTLVRREPLPVMRNTPRGGFPSPSPALAQCGQCTDNTEVMRGPRSARTSHPASALDDGPWCEGTTRSGRRHLASRAFTLHRASCRWNLGMGMCGSAGRMSVDG